MPDNKSWKRWLMDLVYPPPPPPPADVGENWRPQNELVPSHWKKAASTPVGYQPIGFPDALLGYGSRRNASAYYSIPDKRIMFLADYPYDWSKAYPHELGHAAWYRDLDNFDRDAWMRTRAPYEPSTGDRIMDFIGRGKNVPRSAPTSLRGHYMKPDEGFAETYSRYIQDPEGLKKEFPEGHNYFYKATGGFSPKQQKMEPINIPDLLKRPAKRFRRK